MASINRVLMMIVLATATLSNASAQTASVHFVPSATCPSVSDQTSYTMLRAKADKGSASAQALIGDLLAKGINCAPHDPDTAVKYYRLSAAQNNPDGIYGLSFQMKSGQGIAKNETEANRLRDQAAKIGNPRALDAQINQYLFPPHQNPKKVISLLSQIAEYNSTLPALDNITAGGAARELGLNYQSGRNVSKDITRAYAYFLVAAARAKNYLDAPKSIEGQLTPEQRKRGEAMAHRFLLKHHVIGSASKQKSHRTLSSGGLY